MKILLFANTDWYLFNFRLGLARELRLQGHEVVLVSPPGKFAHHLEEAGFPWLPVELSPKGLNPWQDIKTLRALNRIYRQEKPDVAHHFTIKCVLYGSAVAHWNRVSGVINSITGMGYIFVSRETAARWLRPFVILLYRLLMKRTAVIFQNPDDRAFFLSQKMVPPQNAFVIMGSGVDMDAFRVLPELEGIPVVTFASRLIWDKGVGEFVAAARLVKQSGIEARFALVGASDSHNPAAIPMDQIHTWEQEGLIEYWGFREDMRDVLAQTHLMCLPSYREGLARILIEAAASGRALVVTDVPGCREVVQDGVNGLLVPPRDAHALADALCTLIVDPDRRKRMAQRSREIAVQAFSIEQVNQETIAVYQQMVNQGRADEAGARE